jgi:hypothetical protein
MKRENGSIFQKIFGGNFGISSRVPLKSNIYRGAGGYSQIGQTNRVTDSQRRSPLLGNAQPSNLMSQYYERVDELRGYQLLDITKLATNFFADYINNFLDDGGQQIISILDQEGNIDENKTEKINDILTKDLKITDYIRDHVKDMIFFGQYTSLLMRNKDELGHIKFRFEELYDPVSVITKKQKDGEGNIDDLFLARGEDGKIYEIPSNCAFVLGNINLRLINDLDDNYTKNNSTIRKPSFGGTANKENNNLMKILKTKSYSTGEPLFYSMILKVKELIIKEILVSLVSLRDLSSIQIFLLQFDKSTPKETAQELCARTTKLANNTNELASFLTSQFDVVSFIENTLSQSAKFVPDYNSTLGNKNNMIPLDKLSDKILEVMQMLDNCRNAVLSPLGIPSTILDSTSGSKWAILQQSERANSRVTGFMSGIKSSVTDLTCSIYEILYNEKLDPSLIKLHISEKTSVEYNNQINQSESVAGLVNGITGIITNSLQAVEAAAPLIDIEAFLNYLQNLIKDIDPDTESIINDQTKEMYKNFLTAKLKSLAEQQGIDPSVLMPPENEGEAEERI